MLSTGSMRRLLAMTLLGVLASAGCGSDDDKPGRTVAIQSGETLTVVADEYSFDPETIVMRGGRELTIELDNQGSLAHNLRVFDGDTDVGGTPTFQGGDPRSGSLRVEPGDYELVCTVGDHEDLGMTGKLRVE